MPQLLKSAYQNYFQKHFRIPLLYLYGFWIALAYLVFVICMNKVIIGAFATGSLLGGLALASIFPKDLKLSITSPIAWARSIFFALTQYFTFRALTAGDTTAVFCASAASLIIILPIARYVLNEQSGPLDYFAAIFAIFGLFVLAPDSHVTVDGVAAGLFQTASTVASRKAGIQKQSLIGNTIQGMILAGAVCLPMAYADIPLLIKMPLIVILSGILITITQIYFLWISFSFPVASVNQVSQTRIAWSLLLNSAWKLTFPSTPTLAGALIIMTSPFIAAKHTRRLLTLTTK